MEVIPRANRDVCCGVISEKEERPNMSECVPIECILYHRSHDQNKQENSTIGQVFLRREGTKRSTLYKESKISKST
jgi:hypothetical protein